MSVKKRKTISFTVDVEVYEEIFKYARIKGDGGKDIVSNFIRYAVLNTIRRMDLLKKYPQPDTGTGILKKIRSSKIYHFWRKSVLKRDKYHCQKCGSRKNLHVHHVLPFSKYPELRFEITNGITLCQNCHIEEHTRIIKEVKKVPIGSGQYRKGER